MVRTLMPYCHSCGEEVREEAAFCENCGTELDPVDSKAAEIQDGNTTEQTATGTSEEQIEPSDGGISWSHVTAAITLALLPAFGVYMMFSIAANSVIGAAFVVALPTFAYLLYQRPTIKTMLGGMCFWLAVEAFLSPVVMLVYTSVFASQETSSAAGEAGAAIGGTFLMIIAFVVGIPLGIVLYLVSGRLDPDEPSATPTG